MKRIVLSMTLFVAVVAAMAGGKKGFKWNDKLVSKADKGNTEACYQVGYCYMNGNKGELCPTSQLPVDPVQGFSYLKKAADKKHVEASYLVGRCYMDGIGVARDMLEAIDYIGFAARKKHTEAMATMGYINYTNYAQLQQDGSHLSAAQKEKTLKTLGKSAVQMTEMAAKAGSGNAMYNLFTWYAQGSVGLKQDNKKAWDWLQKAAKAEFAEAYPNIANAYAMGHLGLKPDYKKAKLWAEKGMAKGNANSYLSMAILYGNGWGVDTDMERGAALAYQASALPGEPNDGHKETALAQLQFFYENGAYGAADYATFEDWLKSLKDKVGSE